MSAGGVAVHEDAFAKAIPQEQAGALHLRDDVADADVGAEVVACERDGDAVRIQPAGERGEHLRLQRPPVAAMDEHRQRRIGARVGKEDVDELARARPVADAELGASFGRRLRAIGSSQSSARRARISGCSFTRARLLYSAS